MTSVDSLLAEATRLPIPDRIQLIEAIWDTVSEAELPSVSDEWMAELRHRSAEFDANTVETVPWETVRAEALRSIQHKHD